MLIPLNAIYTRTFLYVIKRRMSAGKVENDVNADVKENLSIDCEQIRNSLKHVGNFITNLFFVYLLEYMIIVCWADRIWRKKLLPTETHFLHKNAFTV